MYWIHLTLTSIATVIFLSFFGLTQVVDQPTHIVYGSCHSLIDHVLVSNTCFLSLCQVLPPLSNSDHLGIKVVMKLRASCQKPVVTPQRTIWRYSHANWSKACELINICEWPGLILPQTLIYFGYNGIANFYILWKNLFQKCPFDLGNTCHGCPRS